ncbi:MAG: hypothetical protein NTV46_01735 [Verrucomicrobia bacterium]|nr:hypothetical protein [Verrucomicrobiota bacterium]
MPASETRIPGPIADGTPPAPAPMPVLPPFKATSTVVRRVDVVEPPPMSGLPPVTGTITQTVHLVEDPGLVVPPPPLPALPVTDPVVQARMKAWREKFVAMRLAFVSATVYDHSRTFLRCYPNGGADQEVSGWSNLDFNHFAGFGIYQVEGADGKIREYALLMGIGDADTKQLRASTDEWLENSENTYTPPVYPELPDLATGGPAFVLTDGDTTNKESVALIQGLHDLYRVEGARMASAYQARIKAEAERRAFLLAHPPKPADVTVLFWERAQPARPVRPVLTEGGGR